MSAKLSPQSIQEAFLESDKEIFNSVANQEYNVHFNDGMTLKMPYDNAFDGLINILNYRRLNLEKKAEILHDYYGDRLLAKEIFQRYLNYKSYIGGLSNALTLGILGANCYSLVMKNSVFMGKIGTLASILLLQATSRHFTNNYLENQISRPWKIHTYRMSKGLGPTNIPSNIHREEIICPIRTSFININPLQVFTSPRLEITSSSIEQKISNVQKHHPYELEGGDIRKSWKFEAINYNRFNKSMPEDDGESLYLHQDAWIRYPIDKTIKVPDYVPDVFDFFKSRVLNGFNTIWVPNKYVALDNFEADSKENVLPNGNHILKNEYIENSDLGDVLPDLPSYAETYTNPINLTSERIDLLSIVN